MITLLLVMLALAVTLWATTRLLAANAKRQRIYGLPARAPGMLSSRAWWIIALLPGMMLLVFGNPAALFAWLGAASVLMWLMAARVPAGGNSAHGDVPE